VEVLLHAGVVLKINNFLLDINRLFLISLWSHCAPSHSIVPSNIFRIYSFSVRLKKKVTFRFCLKFLLKCIHIANTMSPANKSRRI